MSLTARTGAFQKKMRAARKSVNRFASSVAGVARKLTLFGGVLAGGAVAGLTILVKQSFKSIDVTAKLADRLNTTTEAIVGLQHAAIISGSSAEAMNKALEKMARNLGDTLIKPTSEATDAFEFLRLNIDKVRKLDTAKAFSIIAENISKVSDASTKAALAAAIFGRAGVGLINTFNLGADGLEKMRAEAERLGATFSRIDAAKVEAANDAFARLSASIRAGANAIAVQLAPFARMLADRLTEIRTAGGDMAAGVQRAFRSIAVAIGKTVDAVSLLRANMLELKVAAQLVELDVLRKIPGTFFKGLALALKEEIDATLKKAAGLRLSDMATAFGKAFDKFMKDAEEAAKRSIAALKPGATLPFLGGTGKGRVGLGKEIRRSLIALPTAATAAPKRVQRVSDPNILKMILQQKITNHHLARGGLATASP